MKTMSSGSWKNDTSFSLTKHTHTHTHIHIYICVCMCMCVCVYIYIYMWCNGYCRRKWIRRHEFKSWTRLIAFHIALIPLGKVRIQLFSLQQWVNSRNRLGSSALVRQLVQEKENSEFKPVKLRFNIDLVSYPTRA